MAIIDDLRAEVTNDVAVEMQAIVEERVTSKIAEKRASLVDQLAQVDAEKVRIEAEILELTPEVETPAEDAQEGTEEPQG